MKGLSGNGGWVKAVFALSLSSLEVTSVLEKRVYILLWCPDFCSCCRKTLLHCLTWWPVGITFTGHTGQEPTEKTGSFKELPPQDTAKATVPGAQSF